MLKVSVSYFFVIVVIFYCFSSPIKWNIL